MKKTNKFVNVIIIIGFLITLYWVEVSPWGSQAVARYNAGYGTFDMKNYDVSGVEYVLGNMEEEGFQVYYNYYLGDYLFIPFLGIIQAIISNKIYRSSKVNMPIKSVGYWFSTVVIILRGIADFIENTLLLVALMRYPNIDTILINIASLCTQVKLLCIRIWLLSILIGIIIKGIEGIGKMLKWGKEAYGKTQR